MSQNLKVYLLTRPHAEVGHDEVNSMVILAENEEDARQEATMKSMDEGILTWLDTSLSDCQQVSLVGGASVICVDALNG